jgi:hypothetical protein
MIRLATSPSFGEDQQPLGVPVEPADGVYALLDVDELHDRPAAALVVHRGDVAAGLVDEEVAERLRAQQAAIDPDLGRRGVDLGAELGDDDAVDHDPTLADQLLGRRGARRRHGCQDSLQSFHGWGCSLAGTGSAGPWRRDAGQRWAVLEEGERPLREELGPGKE